MNIRSSQCGRLGSMQYARWLLSFLLLLAILCIPLGVRAQSGASAADRERLAQFQQSLDSLRRQYAIPGLSAVVVNNGQIIWEAGFGYQDVENQIPATPDTPYRTASITKTFASMLLMKCVERGTLNLDTPIRNYTLDIADSRVTVRHPFTHTSQSNPPGETYTYNGNRFSFLTPVVDSCAGQSFREALAKTILDPLRMNDSVPGQDMEFPSPAEIAMFTPETLDRYKRVIQRLAKPYLVDSSGRPILASYPPRGISTAAGLISTVRDLARYDAAIDQHILLSAQTQEQAWTNHVNSRGQKLPYALGWFVQMHGNERLIWHYGQWDTFSGLYLKVPGRNVTLILLANSGRLSSPFSLAPGNVTGSPFANSFLQMLSDPEAFRASPIESDYFFVRQHYLDFLSREADPSGLQFWVNNIAACGVDTSCREAKRIDTSAAYFLSIEFQQTGYLVHRFYKASFGRRPLFSEFLADTRGIGNGVVVNSPGWEQLLESNTQAFIDSWVMRTDFTSLYDGMGDAQYVDTLIANTGATFSQTDRNALVDALSTHAKSRAQVLRMIADHRAFYDSEFNAAFVEMQYFGYLRRNPQDAPDNDLVGFNYWLNKLNEFGGDFRRAEMVKAFLSSTEYQQRFATQ